jgi:hypothetical protein
VPERQVAPGRRELRRRIDLGGERLVGRRHAGRPVPGSAVRLVGQPRQSVVNLPTVVVAGARLDGDTDQRVAEGDRT